MGKYLLLLLGVFSCSTAIIFIKESNVHPALLAGYRLVLASILLLPLFLKTWYRHRDAYTFNNFRQSIIPALLLGGHLVSWNYGARATDAANAALLVNMVPVAMPFLMVWLVREMINRREILGTSLAMSGVLLMTAGDYVWSRENVTGDLISFGSMLLFAVYLALGRRNRNIPHLWLYVTPLYAMAGIASFIIALPLTPLVEIYPVKEYLLILGLAAIPTLTGHSLLNYAMKHLRGQVVSLCNLGQFGFAGIMAYFFFGEIPLWTFWVSCLLILSGAVIAIRAAPGE